MKIIHEAQKLKRAIETEIAAGTKHYTADYSRELPTVAAVLRELLDHDRISIELPKGRPQPWYLKAA